MSSDSFWERYFFLLNFRGGEGSFLLIFHLFFFFFFIFFFQVMFSLFVFNEMLVYCFGVPADNP